MSKIIYAIPSYKRAGKVRTIEYLNQMGVAESEITIATQNEEEYQAYSAAYPNVNVIQGEGQHAAAARNTIVDAFKGEDVLMLDDDVHYVGRLVGKQLQPLTPEEFDEFINRAFQEAKEANAAAWGVYPVEDPYYMTQTVTTRAVLVGTMMGIRNYYGLRFNENIAIKEDLEYCLQARAKRLQVLRYDGVTGVASHKTKGGCYEDWWLDKECTMAIKMKYRGMLKNTKDETKILVKGGSKREWKW